MIAGGTDERKQTYAQNEKSVARRMTPNTVQHAVQRVQAKKNRSKIFAEVSPLSDGESAKNNFFSRALHFQILAFVCDFLIARYCVP